MAVNEKDETTDWAAVITAKIDENNDLKHVIKKAKKVLSSNPKDSKVSRTKMIEKSKQTFYENLNIQVKEGGVLDPENLKKVK